jgi:hypothetical protein
MRGLFKASVFMNNFTYSVMESTKQKHISSAATISAKGVKQI